MFKTEINYLAHHVSKRGVLPSKKNLEAIARCPPPDTYTKVKSFVGLVGHYRHFIKGFANIAAPLYDLTSGENKDKKSEHLDLPLKAREAFDRLKAACLQAPILAFPDFGKPSYWKQMPPVRAWELCCHRSSLMGSTIPSPMPVAL